MGVEVCWTGKKSFEKLGSPMSTAPDDLTAAALALPPEERAELAKRLIASLDEGDEIDEAWRSEVRRRLDAFRSGEVDSAASEDVFEQARQQSRT
jgi:putative addiction module component (TIGR02574 family)